MVSVLAGITWGLISVMEAYTSFLYAGLVSVAGPHVILAGDDGPGQCSYGMRLGFHGLCPALEVRLVIFLELNLPNLIQCWLEFG